MVNVTLYYLLVSISVDNSNKKMECKYIEHFKTNLKYCLTITLCKARMSKILSGTNELKH